MFPVISYGQAMHSSNNILLLNMFQDVNTLSRNSTLHTTEHPLPDLIQNKLTALLAKCNTLTEIPS